MTIVGFDQAELVTPRLNLRRLERADAALLHLYASDARVARMTTSIPHPYPPGGAESFIARATSRSPRETVWALDAGDGRANGLIGLISLLPRGSGVAEIGYWVAPAFWNAGYAGEAVEAVSVYARQRGLEALTAQVFQDNLASARVLTRAGFAYVGEGEAHSVARAGMVSTFRYRLDLRPA